ncbi:MAG: hypothetical protein J6B76_04625 [Peptococcaceae bacterium]|nr:hypothetical protein [Peptococcaceae bacterium]
MKEIQTSVGLNFRETKEQSIRLQSLRNRSKRCVCRYCGNTLSLRKITYAAYDEAKIELFCEHCNRIEHGVEPEIYKISEYFVDEMRFDHYPNMDESVQKRRMNIAVICDIVYWSLKNMNLLDADGFQISLNMNLESLGETFRISKKELNSL